MVWQASNFFLFSERIVISIDQAIEPLETKLEGWVEGLVGMLPNILVALGVLAATWLLARLSRKITVHLAEKASLRSAVSRLLGSLAVTGVLSLGLFVALGVLRLDKTVMSLLAGAGLIGLALGFAAQNLAANLLSGAVISVRRPYKEGDVIEIGDFFGTVERIDVRLTRVRTPEGQLVLIPNKEMLESPLVNFSTLRPRRVDLEVGVSYDADLETVREATLAVLRKLKARQPGSAVEFFYTGFGDSAIEFVVRFWIAREQQAEYLAARSEAVMSVKRALDAQGVEIPFPIRTINFGEDREAALEMNDRSPSRAA